MIFGFFSLDVVSELFSAWLSTAEAASAFSSRAFAD